MSALFVILDPNFIPERYFINVNFSIIIDKILIIRQLNLV